MNAIEARHTRRRRVFFHAVVRRHVDLARVAGAVC
jgi:hypothetical protein